MCRWGSPRKGSGRVKMTRESIDFARVSVILWSRLYTNVTSSVDEVIILNFKQHQKFFKKGRPERLSAHKMKCYKKKLRKKTHTNN